ncbi:MAG: CocE/NonD family hydrolase [Puia sp.]|nr:CocE/NonD family hydrolase [Puia sp.]
MNSLPCIFGVFCHMSRCSRALLVATGLYLLLPLTGFGQPLETGERYIRDNFIKKEAAIPMRDGVRLYTVLYIPKDTTGSYPFLMERTPYSSGPYGKDDWETSLGPNRILGKEKYIFVQQDVRGRYMSEGQFEEMTPHREDKKTPQDTDESTDTYDTVDWLLKNIKHNNGRVGLYGVSYPGFYASASLPDAHPAIKAVSPQAPVTDEFIGDDANHNGAFFLLDNFGFNNRFDIKRDGPVREYEKPIFHVEIRDAYRFFLDLGPLKNTNGSLYFNHQSKIWDEYLRHSTYDDYWKARNIRPHLKNIRPAILVVGGWFDAEDQFGALRTYEAIEKQSPHNDCRLIMGPWTHGAWERPSWTKFGTLSFGQDLNAWFQETEAAFFDFYLKDQGTFGLSEATVFETGTNQWKHYDTWPPAGARPVRFYTLGDKVLSMTAPSGRSSKVLASAYDEYMSDPSLPVPYVEGVHGGRDNEYMVADQRFASGRHDVLSYQTETLEAPVTVTGRLRADFFISCSGTDADLVVKLIDVCPGNETDPGHTDNDEGTPGMQRMVRAEVFRCKFRNSFERPVPLVSGQPTEIAFDLNEVAHTFKKGHRIMVQVQSSWFPLVDRNPQQFVDIPTCSKEDFQRVTIRVYHDAAHPSNIELPVIK